MLLELSMTTRKGGGRRPESEPGSKLVRVHADLADMLLWIARIEGGTVASLLDPLARPQVAARYKAIEPAVAKIRNAEVAAEKALRNAQAKHKGEKAG